MVRSQLVNSLARPEGNTTGISMFSTELDGKRQEILIEAVPGLRRMAAIADSSTTALSQLQALQDAARARNVELSIHRIARPEEIAAAIDAAKAWGAAALNVLASPNPLRQSPDHHAARRGVAPAGHLSISRSGAGRRLCRLWPTPRP
jgi:putative ABC transport system substrate-binding protein